MVSQRKCCVLECKNNYSSHTLFTFPKIDWTGFKGDNRLLHKGLRRCLYWIQKSGNLLLLKERPEALKGRYFMCSEHFNTVYFSGKSGRILRSNAFPHKFTHSGINEGDMQKYITWIGSSDIPDSPFSSKQRTVSHITDHQSQKIKRQSGRRCKVPNCEMNDSSSTLFAFPRPSYMTYLGAPINIHNYIRCKLWLKAVGNESLLAFNPLNMWRHAYICAAHFEDHHFHSKMKKKLLQTAVPSKHLPLPISDDKMNEYNMLYN